MNQIQNSPGGDPRTVLRKKNGWETREGTQELKQQRRRSSIEQVGSENREIEAGMRARQQRVNWLGRGNKGTRQKV